MFTRRWVVELILDLCGYTPDRPLHTLVAVEPACGSGAFLVPMVERLVAAAEAHNVAIDDTAAALRATDLLATNVAVSRDRVRTVLEDTGVAADTAERLAEAWVRQDAYLLTQNRPAADVVVGNPPYIRLEAVPPDRSVAYRRACETMNGRADVYVGFYEQALRQLRKGGRLGFICADRWMRNAYGARLRSLISESWAVDAIVSMTGVDAFEDDVDAYPAITIIRRGRQDSGPLVVEAKPPFDETDALDVARYFREGAVHSSRHATRYRAARLGAWFQGATGWPSGTPEELDCLADLEDRHAPLEDPERQTRVGIGVATGADRVFVVDDTTVAEPDRLLPLALPRDLVNGNVVWSGSYLVNPWTAEGLADLEQWPRLAGYFERHNAVLKRRHIAKNGIWYRTIDRVAPDLARQEKLYLPDFGERLAPVLDQGRTYPHHNLYWITSDRWDLRVLGGILMSDVANLFISAYSVRMRGGYFRFQAQYLRRIHVPRPEEIDEAASAALTEAFISRDHRRATELALPLYGLERLP